MRVFEIAKCDYTDEIITLHLPHARYVFNILY